MGPSKPVYKSAYYTIGLGSWRNTTFLGNEMQQRTPRTFYGSGVCVDFHSLFTLPYLLKLFLSPYTSAAGTSF